MEKRKNTLVMFIKLQTEVLRRISPSKNTLEWNEMERSGVEWNKLITPLFGYWFLLHICCIYAFCNIFITSVVVWLFSLSFQIFCLFKICCYDVPFAGFLSSLIKIVAFHCMKAVSKEAFSLFFLEILAAYLV